MTSTSALVSAFFLLLEISKAVQGQAVDFSTNVKEYGDGIFQFKESKEYVEMNEVLYPELKIFCYNGKKFHL